MKSLFRGMVAAGIVDFKGANLHAYASYDGNIGGFWFYQENHKINPEDLRVLKSQKGLGTTRKVRIVRHDRYGVLIEVPGANFTEGDDKQVASYQHLHHIGIQMLDANGLLGK